MSREVGYDVVEISKGEIVPLKGISDDDQKITIFDDYMVKKKKKINECVMLMSIAASSSRRSPFIAVKQASEITSAALRVKN